MTKPRSELCRPSKTVSLRPLSSSALVYGPARPNRQPQADSEAYGMPTACLRAMFASLSGHEGLQERRRLASASTSGW